MATDKISPLLKAEIALRRFEPMKDGEPPLPYPELIKYLQSRSHGESVTASVKTVQKAISDAFRLGYVTVQPATPVPPYETDPPLARSLQNQFGLKSALVVKNRNEISSDSLHSQLGHALAIAIHNSGNEIIHSGDVIGVGSGRGVYNTISELNRLERVELDEITIMSLTGSIFSHTSESQLEFLLDADLNCAQLAQHFSGLIHLRPISYPIAHTATARAQLMKKTWLNPETFLQHIPALSLVGVGILGDRHRFYQEVKSIVRSPVLEPIYNDLVDLIKLVESLTRHHPGYSPVGDVANRLFFIPPPLTMREVNREAIMAGIPPYIDRINECLITVRKTELARSRTIALVAGTKIKARAIYSLLRHSIVKVDILSIDSDTAQEVLLLRDEGRIGPRYEARLE